MDAKRFDDLSRSLHRLSRRSLISLVAGKAGFGFAARVVAGTRCAIHGKKCSKAAPCCEGLRCTKKRCACGDVGEIFCDGICTDPNWDSGNCGACGNTCPGDLTCVYGQCVCEKAVCRIRSWGDGEGPSQLGFVYGVAADQEGFVYASSGSRVVKFTSDGEFVSEWGTLGTGSGELNLATGLAVVGDHLFVIDYGNYRVQKFTLDGQFVLSFGSYGFEPGQFSGSYGIAGSPSGQVYVTDVNNAIQWFEQDGRYGGSISDRSSTDSPYSAGIAFQNENRFYVIDTYSYQVSVYERGEFARAFGSLGTLDGRLRESFYIAIGPKDRVFVADAGNNRVQVFTSSGEFLTKWDASCPMGIVFGADGSLYVAEGSGITQYVLRPELS